MGIALRQLPAARIRGASAHWDVCVLAHEQRLEPAFLERARQLADFDPIVSRKMEGTN
jgi:hypothetical protein